MYFSRGNLTGKLNNRGFTLVELLIVVIILAVLAAIVIPQFTSSSDEAKASAMKSTLSEMRNAIELYYHQHNSTYPAAAQSLPAPGTGAAGSSAAFLEQLTMYTNVAGAVAKTKDATYKFGPYLKKQSLPENPYTQTTDVTVVNAGAAWGDITEPAASGATAWWFDTKSGKFVAYDDATRLTW